LLFVHKVIVISNLPAKPLSKVRTWTGFMSKSFYHEVWEE